ncbi:MAG: hypothetical protein ACFFE8_03695 [Candidatus Heimdallarchaeota archaeon]
MALDPIQLISKTLVDWNFIVLIIGGLLAASWLIVRLAGVSAEDLSSTVEKLAIIGLVVGGISLITVGAGIYLFSHNIMGDTPFDIVTIVCLVLLGFILILRPIKDFRFGAFLSLGIGLLGAGFLVFFGTDSVKLLAGAFLLLFFVIYGAIKLVEDLYLLIAETLSSPLISVGIGIMCVLQGVLELLGTSIFVILGG